MADVKWRQAPVTLDTEPGKIRGAEPAHTAAAQQVAGVRQSLGERIGDQEVESLGEAVLQLGLQGMIVGGADGIVVRRTGREVLEGNVRRDVGARRQQHTRVVRTYERLQVAAQRSNITGFERRRVT